AEAGVDKSPTPKRPRRHARLAILLHECLGAIQRYPACCAECTPTSTNWVTCSVISCEAGVVILLVHIRRPVPTSVKVMSAAYAVFTCSPPTGTPTPMPPPTPLDGYQPPEVPKPPIPTPMVGPGLTTVTSGAMVAAHMACAPTRRAAAKMLSAIGSPSAALRSASVAMTGLTPDISIRAAIWSWQMRWMAVALALHTTSTVAPRRDC